MMGESTSGSSLTQCVKNQGVDSRPSVVLATRFLGMLAQMFVNFGWVSETECYAVPNPKVNFNNVVPKPYNHQPPKTPPETSRPRRDGRARKDGHTAQAGLL